MSSLYHKAGQLLVNWSGEDVAGRSDPRQVAQAIVDMILKDLKEGGMISLDRAASHDTDKID